MKEPKVKVVLVTGGSSGIGEATVNMLAQRGMTVYAASRSAKEGAVQGNIVPLKMDVNDPQSVESGIARIMEQQGRLDAIVCNAGNGISGSIEDTTQQEAKYQFETCFFGAHNTVRAALPVFRQQGHGRIVTVSSVAAMVPIPYQAFYSATKAAVLMYTKALAMEVGRFGVKCCSVLPGDTKTGFTKSRRYTEASQNAASPYFEKCSKSVQKMEKDEQGGMPPSRIAQSIVRQLTARRMNIVCVPRLDYWAICLLTRLLPNKLMLFIVKMIY